MWARVLQHRFQFEGNKCRSGFGHHCGDKGGGCRTNLCGGGLGRARWWQGQGRLRLAAAQSGTVAGNKIATSSNAKEGLDKWFL